MGELVLMKSDEKQSLEQTLESAIVVSWKDLMHGTETGLVHIEYNFAPTGTIDYLKVWSSVTRGHWLLACEYWMSETTFHSLGVHFDNGYESEGLAHILESVMQHQSCFALPLNRGRQGLLQIPTPTEEDRTTAAEWVHDAFDRMGSALAEPAVV
jgi:hypothetical protein